uniref:(northern house mosquito) hypothetical protein n=1 Tax=Culex pipiens TaxID=7175 RepID=A0A8D8IS80_CULPI
MAAKLLPGTLSPNRQSGLFCWLSVLFVCRVSLHPSGKSGNSIVDTQQGVCGGGGKWRTRQFSSHRCVFQFLPESLGALCVNCWKYGAAAALIAHSLFAILIFIKFPRLWFPTSVFFIRNFCVR